MLYVLNQKAYTEEEAATLTGLELIKYKKDAFIILSRKVDLNQDMFFKRCVEEIDLCDIPFPNVIRDPLTGNTHSFDKVSGGVTAMWLMNYYNDRYIMPTSYFGENCYQIMLDISKEKDVYVYDDAGMLYTKEIDECKGVFTDYKTKRVIVCENREATPLAEEEGYL